MKKVYASPDLLSAGHVRNLLEQNGIASQLRNYYLGGGIGDLPVNECWPEIWVDDSDVARAEQVVRELQEALAEPPGPPWICPACGERNEGQFGECWHCGATRPASVGTP
ncbi:hypothetical protein BJI67_00270 [Acidihalobacter aeolianus]|uniref:RanBP2-type domain-containing protein n=1 Tax=Acidihalobacter aeolianus TaxID=2792603 RepID=A0A1D8K424_9GAMM|nr:DUF2007 domain-containing protein [Acidihalobacter aeolianus]AOV15702.1 hypothetical protein BJI67_00270 [Acidihalobacter aeolianus]